MQVKTFIDRPIMAGVISVLLVLVGIVGLVQLPIEQFPEIAPPTVRVNASYSGANAETVQKSVVVPLEEAINGVEGMIYMTSSASNTGSANINVFFRKGIDPDMAMVNVQNRVATVQGKLPSEVTKSGLTIRKRQTSNIKQLALYSPDSTFDRTFLANYAKINIEPRLSRITGVGDVSVMGADYAMRIWLDPKKMYEYGLNPSEIVQVLSEQNVEVSTGTLGAESENTFQYVLKYRGRYEEEKDYEKMVIKAFPNGNVLRLGDVAEVVLDAADYNYIGETQGKPGVNLMISQMPGSNANEIIQEIDRMVVEIQKTLPKGMEMADLESKKDFLDASILSVLETLLEALLLVVFIVYLFLQSFRSTIIPSIAILVSLISTFAFLFIIGFSLNMLTLFALVLVIGTVVDDAIVVVEAVQAKLDEGYTSSYTATVDAMKGITSALVTTTLVFMAVFVPVCFISGVTGTFYTQFGVTMAVAVAISCLNALTLSPALCALLMKSHTGYPIQEKSWGWRYKTAFNAAFERMTEKYKHAVVRMTGYKRWVVLLVALAIGGLATLVMHTKTGLVPSEDMGTILVNVQAAPGTSLKETHKILRQVEDRIKDIPEIRIYSMFAGSSTSFEQSSSNGNFTIKLKKWADRKGKEHHVSAVMAEIYRRTADISNAKIQVNTQTMIPGYGRTNGLEIHVQDRKGGSLDDLEKYTALFIDSLNKRKEISRAYTNFNTHYPQYRVEVDAVQCKRNGVSPSDVLSALSIYVGGNYASNLNRFTKLYRVMVQADPQYRLNKESLDNLYVKNAQGQMTPIGQYLKLTRIYGSETLSRFNLFPSILVGGTTEEGYSAGQAINAVQEVAEGVLPDGYGFEFGGMTREEASADNMTALVFGICIIFIYLILCALYESLFIPLAVILSVPFGLAGSFVLANICGIENNIYMQTGLIMLIGLLAKTAILLTEYASERRKKGMGIIEAAVEAAKVRFRPILMTSLTMIFGLLPLALSTGVGANGNRSLGIGTIGGMLVGTIAILVVVPVLFVIFQKWEEMIFLQRHNHE